MDSEIIKALKENEKPFGLMSEGMQAKALDIGWNSFEVALATSATKGYDMIWGDVDTSFEKRTALTYRLRSDYKEPPTKVAVRIIRGDGFMSPTSQRTFTACVKEFEGRKYVSLESLEHAVKSIAAAEYWLKKLDVWGNSDHIKAILKGNEPTTAAKEEPEVVKCRVIKDGITGLLVYCRPGYHPAELSKAVDDPDFVGCLHDGDRLTGVTRDVLPLSQPRVPASVPQYVLFRKG